MSRNPIVRIDLDGPTMPHMSTPCYIPIRQDHQLLYPPNAKRVRAFVPRIDHVRNVVRHICDNQECVNLAHLIAGRALDNTRDRWERGTSRAPQIMRQWHEVRGHVTAPTDLCPPHIEERLGTLTDVDLARACRVERGRVTLWRRERGIVAPISRDAVSRR